MDKRLEVFIAVVEAKSFSKAASLLHMTQPAVSQYIRSLEEDMGTRLLERTNKYVSVNQAGEIVYHHAIKISGLYRSMFHLVDDLLHVAAGKLRIGASYTFGEYVLPTIIAKMKKQYPAIETVMTIGNTEKISSLIEQHQLDVGIIEGEVGKVKATQTIFTEDELYIVASSHHPLSKKKVVIIKDLAAETWIIREQGSGTRGAMHTFWKELGINPEKVIEFSSTQPIKEMISSGFGIGFLSTWTIQKEIADNHLKIIPIEETPYIRPFSYLTHTPFQTKAEQIFLEMLKSHMS